MLYSVNREGKAAAMGAPPVGPTVRDLERIGLLAATRISRQEAETLLGEGLRDDVGEYTITRGGRALRVQAFGETPMFRRFWVIWFPDGTGISVFEWRAVADLGRIERPA